MIGLLIAVAGDALARGGTLLESLLGDLFSNRISVRLMEHAATLDLAQFEDSEFYDHLERARRQTVGRIGLIALLLASVQDLITLVSLAATLVFYVPWLLLLLVVAVVPSFLGETHFAALGYSLLFRWTPERRQLDYLRYIGASDETAKEIKLFGLSQWLIDRYARLAEDFYEANRALSIRHSAVSTLLATVGTLGYYGAYGVIIYLTVIGYRSPAGLFTIGVLTFLAGSFQQSRDLIQRVLLSPSQMFEQSLYLADLFTFFEMKPTIVSREGARAVPSPIARGFEFEDVGFRYPGSDGWAVRHLTFRLGAGERIALVGENGAGKTTLIKLLARLYDPDEGTILLDGVDLREYDVASLRRSIGVIFQDFVRYDFLLRENIGVGEIGAVEDTTRIETAAERSLAAGRPAARKALRPDARAPVRRAAWTSPAASGRRWRWRARTCVTPSSSSSTSRPRRSTRAPSTRCSCGSPSSRRGRMAVLISHRFSTVRMADRILVLEKGRDRGAGIPRGTGRARRDLRRTLPAAGCRLQMNAPVLLLQTPRG